MAQARRLVDAGAGGGKPIGSCAADMLPWMCGRQTFTIVVSSPCMTQPQMTAAVVALRLGTFAHTVRRDGNRVRPVSDRLPSEATAGHVDSAVYYVRGDSLEVAVSRFSRIDPEFLARRTG